MSPTKMLSAAGVVAVCLAIAAGVAWAGNRGCVSFLGFPILVWCAVLAFAVFVALLLTRISGIPILEKRSDERWGDDPAYQRYQANTPALVPRPSRS